MKVFIVEDERLGLERLIKLLHETDAAIEVLGHAETIKSAVWWLQNHPAPDLIFMDIELADGQCFQIFSQVDVQAPIVFTTSYDEYALQAFQVNSVDYLLKPIRREELERSLEKYGRLKEQFGATMPQVNIDSLIEGLRQVQQPKSFRKRFLVRQGQRLLSIEVEDIAWFMVDGKLCFFRTWDNQRYLLDYTLEELSDMLDPEEFFRANRSVLLRAKAVKVINPHFNGKLMLQLSPPAGQEEVIVSKEKAMEFKRWMGK